jgi:hypothetical protein
LPDCSLGEGPRPGFQQAETSFDLIGKEMAARAATGRLISATAGSRPVPSLNFGEAREAALSSLTSHQAVRYAAQLLNILIDKILSTTETKY